MTRPSPLLLTVAALLAAGPVTVATAAPICTPRDEADVEAAAGLLREALDAQAPQSTDETLTILRRGSLRCADHQAVVLSLASSASQSTGARSDLDREVAVAAWTHLQQLRPDAHTNPSYQARVVHLEARRSPLDLGRLAAAVSFFEAHYGPGTDWEAALAADPQLLVEQRATRTEVLEVAASAAHARARETRTPEDWDQALTWLQRLGGEGRDPTATRAWALAAWESGDRVRAEQALRDQAAHDPDVALLALGTLVTLHWNRRVAVRGGGAGAAGGGGASLVLEGGHTRPRWPMTPDDEVLLSAADDWLALSPPAGSDPEPAALALGMGALTLTHGWFLETRVRLRQLLETWPASEEATLAAGTLVAIGEMYGRASRPDRPADLCADLQLLRAWAEAEGASVADADTLGAIAGWRLPRCR